MATVQPAPPTRRFTRHPIDLPVRVIAHNGNTTVVAGVGTQLNEGGMALYATLPMQPGDLAEIEFLTAHATRLQGVVRDTAGSRFGLEFLTPLLKEDGFTRGLRPAAIDLVHTAVDLFDRLSAAEKGASVYTLLAEALNQQGKAAEAQQAAERANTLTCQIADVRAVLRETSLQISRVLAERPLPPPPIVVPPDPLFPDDDIPPFLRALE